MKNILIITYYWPPSGGAGVQRWLKFIKYLSQNDKFNIHIYTVKNPESPEDDDSLLKDIPKNINIIKRKIWEPLGIYKKITGQKRISAGFLNEKKKQKNNLLQKLSIYIRGNLFIPDAKMFWIKPSVKFLNSYIKEKNINTLITTGPPHSVNMIGLKLKQKIKTINWISDFRDPWTNIDFYKDLNLTKFADKKHKRLEKKVLQTADKIITVGQTLANELQQISKKNNINVITNGFDSTDFKEFNKKQQNKFTIAHIGSINKDRNHEAFYIGIKNYINTNNIDTNSLSILFIGKLDATVISSLQKYELTNYCKIINYLPHNKAIQYMYNADILYLPINNTPNAKGILTGKFFEYLTCKNPILTIGPTDGDVAHIIKKTNSGKVFNFSDNNGITDFLINFNKKEFTFVDVEQYSRKQLTKKLINILNEL